MAQRYSVLNVFFERPPFSGNLKNQQVIIRIIEYQPLTIAEMAVSLYAANEGYLDDVDVKKVVDFEHALHSYMRAKSRISSYTQHVGL